MSQILEFLFHSWPLERITIFSATQTNSWPFLFFQRLNFFRLGGALVLGCSCVFAMIGAWIQKRWLMIPYLIVQMLVIVMIIIIGIPISAILFYHGNVFFAICVCMVIFLTSILPIHFWFTVKSAYSELRETGQLSKYSRNINLKCG